jgi:hypothetical protein
MTTPAAAAPTGPTPTPAPQSRGMTTPAAAAPTGPTPTPAPQSPEPKAPVTDPKATEPKTTPEPKAQEPKVAEPDLLDGDDKAAPGAPATAADIEITVPDGVEVDKGMLDGFKAIAKDLKLESKSAQKVVDFYVGKQKEAIEAQESAWTEQKQQWREAASKDKEIGGAQFDANVALARKTIDKFGGPGLKQALKDLQLGNHPEIIRFAVRVGKAMSEDTIVPGNGPGGGKSDAEAQLRAAFPSMFADKINS